LGQLYVRQENFAAADAAYKRAMGLRKAWPVPYLNLGQSLVKQGKTDEAIVVYRSGLALQSDNVALLFPLALSYEKKGSYDEAIRTYETILEKNPDLDAAANNLAALLSDYRYSDPAMLDRALKLTERFQNSDNGFYLDTLGWIYYRMGEYDQALSLIGKAADLQGGIPQIQYHLGMVLKARGEHDRARQALRKAVSSGSDYPGIEVARATLSKMP
jgi:tetratricopeptide (TPR) repeat protein